MNKVTIRYQRVSDARRFYEILKNPHFIYFPVRVASVEDEKKYLKTVPKLRKANTEWNYTVLLNNKVVGAIGIKINSHRNFIGEIGYFLDEKYWGRGITPKAVKLAEKEGFKKLGLTRIEILMQPENQASEKVAVKCGYLKEGLMKKAVRNIKGKKADVLLYAKTL
jgi:ribosomal-protein-alanine N-acetyltransferase